MRSIAVAVELFRSAAVPKRLIPATIALGSVAAAIMLAGGLWWLGRRVRRAQAAGEGYGEHDDAAVPAATTPGRQLRPHAQGEGYDIAELDAQPPAPAAGPRSLPGFALALAPIVGVVVLNWLFSIALQTLGATYLAMAQAAGIAPELLHRVTTVATGGLDTLPHNGAVITLLAICRLTHRQSYFDIFVVAVVFPLLALVVIVTLGSVFGAF